MARQCKCKVCQRVLTTDIAYKVVVNNKAQYYCSEEEYVAMKDAKDKEQIIRDAFNDVVTKIWQYKMINTFFYKEKAEWLTITSEEMITKYLQENETYLSQTIARLDGTEYAKIRYFSAIIKNGIRDFKPKEEPKFEIKISTEEHYETKYKPKERVGLLDLEDEYDE